MARTPALDRYPVETKVGYSRAKCQARFRGEAWDLTLEDWLEFWTRERWPERGRTAGTICLTRRHPDQPWSRTNCCLIPRFDSIRVAKAKQSGRDPDPAIWATAIYLD
jgi:hypothetical protein